MTLDIQKAEEQLLQRLQWESREELGSIPFKMNHPRRTMLSEVECRPNRERGELDRVSMQKDSRPEAKWLEKTIRVAKAFGERLTQGVLCSC